MASLEKPRTPIICLRSSDYALSLSVRNLATLLHIFLQRKSRMEINLLLLSAYKLGTVTVLEKCILVLQNEYFEIFELD